MASIDEFSQLEHLAPIEVLVATGENDEEGNAIVESVRGLFCGSRRLSGHQPPPGSEMAKLKEAIFLKQQPSDEKGVEVPVENITSWGSTDEAVDVEPQIRR